ncbi:MAG: PhzF family phenazine biosynthesis protein [Candidatus Azobacteroides sp.]|nr:PhzF family phenazine biosynthesis protein [Candidatus Azobacteroides sp.]
MKQKIYQVDAFTNTVFKGNPAAVCPLTEWLLDEVMQRIANENNLSETAFFVKEDDRYILRWFTPEMEIDLCGHATLASAFVLWKYEGYKEEVIRFYSPKSGELPVSRNGNLLTLDFPSDKPEETVLTEELLSCFNIRPQFALKGKTDYILVFSNEKEIKELTPDLNAIVRLNGRGVIGTASGKRVDFVSRFFAPAVGVDEDPVTGSTHTTLAPYWSKQLNKRQLKAIQLSKRTGWLECSYEGERVKISGECVLYLIGEINII